MKKYCLIISYLIGINFIKVSAQNVGIGTATPMEKLSVVSLSGYGISHESSLIKLSTYIDGSGGYFGTVTNNPFHLFTNNGAAQFTLLPNGNIGIGATNPLQKLHVVGDILSTSTIITQNLISGHSINVSGDIFANMYYYNSAKTFHYSLSGSDFNEVNSGNVIQREGISGGGIYMQGSNSSTGLVAPVHLPEGAVVKKMTVYFYDLSSITNLNVFLQRSNEITQMASITTSDIPGDGSLFDNSILLPTVYNSNAAFVVYAVPVGGNWQGSSLILRRVIIEYTLTGM